jgi:hypothetical protein
VMEQYQRARTMTAAALSVAKFNCMRLGRVPLSDGRGYFTRVPSRLYSVQLSISSEIMNDPNFVAKG